MKLLSFNILADQYVDYSNLNNWYPTIGANDIKISKRLPIIIKHIKAISADIVMLQEMTDEVDKLLQKKLKGGPDGYAFMPVAWHKLTDKTIPRSGNLTLIKKSFIKELNTKVSHKSVFLADQSDVVSVVTLGKYIIVNIHLNYEFHSIRMKQAKALHAYLKPYYKTHGIILAGDFNTDMVTVHKNFRKLTSCVKSHTGTYLCENTMIDWIYTNLQVLGGKVLNDTMNKVNCYIKTIRKYGSDHHPVIAVVKKLL